MCTFCNFSKLKKIKNQKIFEIFTLNFVFDFILSIHPLPFPTFPPYIIDKVHERNKQTVSLVFYKDANNRIGPMEG